MATAWIWMGYEITSGARERSAIVLELQEESDEDSVFFVFVHSQCPLAPIIIADPIFYIDSDQMPVIRACNVGDGGVPYRSWSQIFGSCRFLLLFIFNAVRDKRILSFTKVIKIS